jgi:Protein of unknown function (DUF1552)
MRTLDRRTFLRGAGGVGIALPFLEAMLPRHASAQTAPRRYVVCFAGMSLGRDNAGKLTDIVPDRLGAGFDLKVPLAPLGPIQDDVTVVSNLEIPIGGVGGRLDGFHKTSISPLLSGTTPTSIAPNCNGITSDQVVANDPAFKGKTKFPSLQLRVQADAYRGGGNVGVISWQGAGKKNDPTVSPGLAFDNLFAGFMPPGPADGGDARAQDLLRRRELSVLDLVNDRAQKLKARLGQADRVTLDRHFEEIRALELRLSAIPGDTRPAATPACGAPGKPGSDPAVSLTTGGGADIGYAGEEERAQALTAILAKALICDLTRVATLQYTCVQCFMNVEQLVGVRMDLHELAHLSTIQGGKDVAQQKVMEMYAWHMKHFTSLATQLKAALGPDGRPMLDSTSLVFVNEGGLGPAEGKNPAAHSTQNMMMVLAGGRAGGLKPGRHIRADLNHPAQVVAGAMNAAGVAVTGLGDVKGRFEPLFAG